MLGNPIETKQAQNQFEQQQFSQQNDQSNNNGFQQTTHYQQDQHLQQHVQQAPKQDKKEEIEYYNSIKSPDCFVKFTSSVLPKTKIVKQNTKLDYGIHFQPMNQQYEIPLASFNKKVEIVRCSNCAAYMNPFVQFKNDGWNWDCNLCHSQQKTPESYYSKLDKNYHRLDKDQKTELNQSSYDIIATEKFMSKPPQPASFIFLVDVSNQNTENNQLINSFCNTLKYFIENPDILGSGAQICIITFSDQITLYDCSSRFNSPHIIVLTDLDVNFIPGDFLFEIEECQENLLFLMEMLPQWQQDNKNRYSEDVLGKTINLANHFAEEVGGHIYIFQDSNIQKESILNFSNLKTEERAKNVYNKPSHSHYTTISEDNGKVGLYYHIFIFSNEYKNIITFGELVKHGNGNLFYYDKMNQFEQFEKEFQDCLYREQSYDSVFRIRLSFGWGKDAVIGNYTSKINDLITWRCDSKQSIFYKLSLMNDQQFEDFMYVQSSLLYTTKDRQRRVRVHNSFAYLSNDKQQIFDSIDVVAYSAYMIKEELKAMYRFETPLIRNRFMNQAKTVYQSAGNKTESLQDFPLYCISVMKHDLFLNQYNFSLKTDQLNAKRIQFLQMNPIDLTNQFVPYLYDAIDDCNLLNLSFEAIQDKPLLLMDIGDLIILYINTKVITSQELQTYFCIQELTKDTFLTYDDIQDVQQTKILLETINTCYNDRFFQNQLQIVISGQNTQLEQTFYYNLIESAYTKKTGGFGMDYSRFIKELSSPIQFS